MNPNEFICPECGSHDSGMELMVSPDVNKLDSWSHVLQRIQCARCQSTIPAHLAERWNNLSVEEAQKEWRKDYRARGRKRVRKASK